MRVVLAALVLALAVGLDYALYPRLAGVGGEPHPGGGNGVWMRYWWYNGDRPAEELPGVVADLRARGISQLYFNVGQVGADGRLQRGRPESARRMIAALKGSSATPIAWAIALNPGMGGQVDISDPAVRVAMVEEARWLVADCGFRGVQWDWEYARGATDELLALLHETRAALPEGAIISIATPAWRPWPTGAFGWREDDFARIAPECDQICVMCYDTAMFLPRAYVGLTRGQVLRVAPAVAAANPDCRVLIGVPTYGDPNSAPSHHAHAENLRMALKGLREGNTLLQRRHPGVPIPAAAIFANWTTEPPEWRTWDEVWVGP